MQVTETWTAKCENKLIEYQAITKEWTALAPFWSKGRICRNGRSQRKIVLERDGLISCNNIEFSTWGAVLAPNGPTNRMAFPKLCFGEIELEYQHYYSFVHNLWTKINITMIEKMLNEKLRIKYNYIKLTNYPNHKRSVLFQNKITLNPLGGRVSGSF